MPQLNKLLRGTVLLTLGQVASYGLSFARNVILARLLTKADFGMAALFGMTISLLEVAGRMSFGQQIIQSKHGDSESFQATSHAFQAALALIGAFLILILSYPVARIMKVPQHAWAFATLAVVPLARAIEHLDYFRLQRELNYLPAVLCDLVPQIVVTVAAWPLAIWLGDFRVIVWLMIGKAALGVLMSQLLARHPYRWAWHANYIKGMCTFGLPLFINGLLIFASQQADQVVVGAYLSLEKLASYALALSLVSIPWSIFAQVVFSLMLPVFSRAQDDPALFRRQYRTSVEYTGVAAVALTLPLIVAGEQFVTLIYGPKYTETGVLMAVLGAASAVRFLRIVPAIASMAKADTMNQLYTNIWRGLSLPLAAFVASLEGGVILIAACALVAELVATVVTVLRLRRRQGIPLRDTAGSAAYVLSFVGAGLMIIFLGAPRWGFWPAGAGVLTVLVLSIVVGVIVFPASARMLILAISQRLRPRLRSLHLSNSA
jgi:O-antigen/teichoic acid export membrane protein